MIGLILMYFLGKYFYDLARIHNKSEWGYAILGVVTYYLGTFIGGFIIGGIIILLNNQFDSTNNFFLSILSFPIGLLFAYLLYKYLKKKWSNSSSEQFSDILDQDLINDDYNLN